MGQASFAVAFLGGLAAVLSPCAAMLLPGFFALTFARTGTLVGRLVLFLAGLLATMVPLGLAAGGLGQLLMAHAATLVRLGGLALVVLGLVTACGVGPSLPGRRGAGRRDPATPLAIVLMGASYGLASGCTGPILGSVLTLAALGGDPGRAGALMVVYCLGMVLPLLVLSLAWQRFPVGARSLARPRPLRLGPLHTTWAQALGGAVFVVAGLVLLASGGTPAAVLDADSQYRLENWLAAHGARVGDAWVLGALVLLVGALVWHWLGERERGG